MVETALIDPERVQELFMQALYDEGEDHIVVEGVVNTVGMVKVRLEPHLEEIRTMLHNLPIEFRPESEGGGHSFLQACVDKNGVQWTGMHMTMEQLFQMGIALGLVDYLMPRELWPRLPGGVPYIVVH